MDKQKLNVQATKKEFVKSIFKFLQETLKRNGNEAYSDMFTITDSSIMCKLPPEYFDTFEIPENTLIEMKFISKKV